MKDSCSAPHRLTLRADPRELARLSGWVDTLAATLGTGDRDRFRLDLALTEVVTNIMAYAYPPGVSTGTITLQAEIGGSLLRVTITDQGDAFDPLTAPLQDQPLRLEDATPGGLGLVLIRGYCDDYRYERANHQNRLSLHFHLEPGTAVKE